MSVKTKPTAKRSASWRILMGSIPMRNEAAKEERHEDKSVRLVVELEKPLWYVPPVTWWMKEKPHHGWELGRLGSEVWDWCDDQRSVEQIIDLFNAQHGLRFHEGRVAVAQYLKMLAERRLLLLKPPTQTNDSPKGE